MTRTRTKQHHQDLILMTLLCLDSTGHGLGPGSVEDITDMASVEALEELKTCGLVRTDSNGVLDLTDTGRAEARTVAARLGGAP